MAREIVVCDRIAPTVGPFSAAVRSGNLLFVSGQVAQDPASGKLIEGDVASQTEHAFRNLSAVLESAGKSLDDVVRIGVFLTDMKDFKAMNDVYARFFSAPFPARTTVAVSELPLGAAVEFDAIAQ